MLSQKVRGLLKDVLLMSLIFMALSGAYHMVVVTMRYRALTQAYIVQSEQLITILNQQAEKAQSAPNAGE